MTQQKSTLARAAAQGAPAALLALALTLATVAPPARAALSTIELTQGGAVTAEVLSDKPDRLVVDLGFTLLAIPRDSIARVVEVDEEGGSSAVLDGHGEDLFRSGSGGEILPIKELVDIYGERVVLIRTPTGLGSGFIIHPDGYVVTNDHVIAGEYELSITIFKDGENELSKAQYDNVRIVASSSELDLALLKIEGAGGERFKAVSLGESDDLRQGQTVFAIGNPLGLERTVSEGIVSIKNRLTNGKLFIQTTTQINPGNSGGPLFNKRGEVIGVNNMKVIAQGAEGLGFAIPSNVLKTFLRNRDAFAFDPRNPNAGFKYNQPPSDPAEGGSAAP